MSGWEHERDVNESFLRRMERKKMGNYNEEEKTKAMNLEYAFRTGTQPYDLHDLGCVLAEVKDGKVIKE